VLKKPLKPPMFSTLLNTAKAAPDNHALLITKQGVVVNKLMQPSNILRKLMEGYAKDTTKRRRLGDTAGRLPGLPKAATQGKDTLSAVVSSLSNRLAKAGKHNAVVQATSHLAKVMQVRNALSQKCGVFGGVNQGYRSIPLV
jgi:hypothetical protein